MASIEEMKQKDLSDAVFVQVLSDPIYILLYHIIFRCGSLPSESSTYFYWLLYSINIKLIINSCMLILICAVLIFKLNFPLIMFM